MSKSYSVAEARAHLPEILDAVEAGRDVHLTRRGRLVAVVLSADQYEALRGEHARFGEAYRRFLERHSVKEIDLDTEFFASLRDRRPGRPVRL